MNGGKEFKDHLQPEAVRQSGIRSIERGAKAFVDPGQTMDSDTGRICVWDVEVKGVLDSYGVRECVLREDLGKYFEEGWGWVGHTK
jgi:hypothetical protein